MSATATDVLSAIASWVGAIATLGGVVIALVALRATLGQIRLTADKLAQDSDREAQDSEARTRPYVDVSLALGLGGPPTIDLVIENRGRTVAKEVELSLSGGGFEPLSESDTVGPLLGELFSRPFDLSPGARRRVIWHIPDSEDAAPRGAMGAPESGDIVIAYCWHHGDERLDEIYTESLRYNVIDFARLAPLPSTGSVRPGNDSEAAIVNAVHALRSIASNVGELRR